MEKSIKIFTGLLIITLAILSFTERKIFNDDEEVNTLLEARKVIINDIDKKKIDSLSAIFSDKIEIEDKEVKNSVNAIKSAVNSLQLKENAPRLKEDTFNALMTAVDTKNKALAKKSDENLEVIKEFKNKTVYKYEESKQKDSPNIWLIILIILTAGIIGGWARVNYALLLPIKNDLQSLISRMISVRDEIDGLQNNQQPGQAQIRNQAVNLVSQKTDDLKLKIESIINDLPTKKQRVNTSMTFGVIASSIAILALKLTDSKVLEFNDTIDYFILWAWCLLGAVYAKDSIERIYNKNFNPNNNG